MNTKDLIGEELTVAQYMSMEYFPWNKEDDEYSHNILIQEKVCSQLGCTPDFVYVVTSDNTSNFVEFTKLYDIVCQEFVKSKVDKYNIIEYDGELLATTYEEGGLEVMYIVK